MPAREGRRVAGDRNRRRYSTPSNSAITTTKVHIVLPPTPEPQPQAPEICYVPTFAPIPAPIPAPAPNPTYSIEATAAEIADRIIAENAAQNEITALQTRLEEEQELRLKAEHDRGREEARRIRQEIDSSRRSRELIHREDDARRRIAEEYRLQTRSLGNSPKSSGESLWSTSPRASSSHDSRLVVHDHRHSHHRSHSDSRSHRCSNCGHSGHRSKECRSSPEPIIYRVPTNRVRHITYLS